MCRKYICPLIMTLLFSSIHSIGSGSSAPSRKVSSSEAEVSQENESVSQIKGRSSQKKPDVDRRVRKQFQAVEETLQRIQRNEEGRGVFGAKKANHYNRSQLLSELKVHCERLKSTFKLFDECQIGFVETHTEVLWRFEQVVNSCESKKISEIQWHWSHFYKNINEIDKIEEASTSEGKSLCAQRRREKRVEPQVPDPDYFQIRFQYYSDSNGTATQ